MIEGTKMVIIALAFLAMTACGGGSSSSGGGDGSDRVRFELDRVAGPTCHGADDISTFEGNFLTIVDCTWQCADFKGREDAWVSIDFQRRNESGARWEKSSEFVSDGVCRDREQVDHV